MFWRKALILAVAGNAVLAFMFLFAVFSARAIWDFETGWRVPYLGLVIVAKWLDFFLPITSLVTGLVALPYFLKSRDRISG